MPYTFRARFCPICGCGGQIDYSRAEGVSFLFCGNISDVHHSYNPSQIENRRVIAILDVNNDYQLIRENPAKPLGFLRRINRLRRQFGLPIWRELPSVEEWLHQSPFE